MTEEQKELEALLISIYDLAEDIMVSANLICVTTDKAKIEGACEALATLVKAIRESAGLLPGPN